MAWVRNTGFGLAVGVALTHVLSPSGADAQALLQPQSMRQIGEVDPRFVSYNIEAVEVTGGRFWKPYNQISQQPAQAADSGKNQPTGMDPALFQYRPPIDLTSAKLRKLAAALGPSYLRVSGTWRNSTYFQNTDQPAPATPPQGFQGVMTRAEWKGVVDFARAVNAGLVTSVATSQGTRDSNGVWTPKEAKGFFDYTKSLGAHIAATEFMNEPTFASIGGAPANYDAAAFARDVKVFASFLKQESPGTFLVGPGSVGEGAPIAAGAGARVTIATEDMLKATGPVFDAFSYHYYGAASKRCKGGITQAEALTTAWLDKNITVEEFYANLRNKYLPGKPMWLTETGEAACGGDPEAATFLDALRFMDQLGSLARRSVKTVMVNTLAASDYGLLDQQTLDPRPDYWAALVWRRTMGTRALEPGITPPAGLRVYAHCAAGKPGGVAVLAVNISNAEKTLELPMAASSYTLSAPELTSHTVLLNGMALKAADDGSVPEIKGQAVAAGVQHLAPHTITFLTVSGAKNAACK